MPLTQQENNFVDHLDYESLELTGHPGMPVPACNWMTAHRLSAMEIINVLNLRRLERGTPEVKEPTELYAPAWKTGEEAKRRNQELAEEADDAKRTGRTPHAED